MSEKLILLTEDQFDHQYPLVPNHLNSSAGWALGEGFGCLFNTFGEELAFVRQQDPRSIWTLVDTDDGQMALVSGVHLVNRVGYLISAVPVPEDTVIEVLLDFETIE
jgi:hypothetical protein